METVRDAQSLPRGMLTSYSVDKLRATPDGDGSLFDHIGAALRLAA